MKTTKNVKESAKKSTTAKVESAKTTTTAKAESKSTTTKMSGMVATLKSLLPNIKDKKLKAEVENSLKVIKNAKPEDIAALIARVIETGKITPAVANEVKKPTVKKPVAKTETKTEEKKTVTKTKTTPKKEEAPVKSVQSLGNTKPPTASIFPETTTIEIEGKKVTLRKVADDEFTTFKELSEAVENGELPYIAGFWSKRHIKEYNYKESFRVKQAPSQFPDDLDILQGLYVSEVNEKYYATSIYTDAMYVFYNDELVPVEDKNPYTGEKYSVRVSNGMEFAVYIEDKAPKKTVKKTK